MIKIINQSIICKSPLSGFVGYGLKSKSKKSEKSSPRVNYDMRNLYLIGSRLSGLVDPMDFFPITNLEFKFFREIYSKYWYYI